MPKTRLRKAISGAMTPLQTIYTWLTILLVSAAGGVVYHFLFARHTILFVSATFGLFIGTPIFAFVRGLLFPALSAKLRSLAFPIYAPSAICLCVASIMVSNLVAGTLFWSLGIIRGSYQEDVLAPPDVIAYSLAVSAILAFLARITDLIGRDYWINLLIGR